MFSKHPRGLPVLFFTEMWERFSYYGMRALLLLFMTATAINGGLNMDVASASAIYGLYTFGVYALALPGGWMADKIFGQRKAVCENSQGFTGRCSLFRFLAGNIKSTNIFPAQFA